MSKNLLFFLFITATLCTSAQDDKHGTIKVQKKANNIRTLIFDNVNNRLVGKDHSGNILDSAVISYTVLLTIQGVAHEEKVIGSTLSPRMQNSISRVDGGTTIFFSDIKVKEKNGSLLDWPKFSTKLGFVYEKEEN